MKTKVISTVKKHSQVFLFCFLMIGYFAVLPYSQAQISQSENLIQYRGKVVDSNTKKGLQYASISILETNTSTVTNSEGEFVIKVNESWTDKSVLISYLGYSNKTIPLSTFTEEENIILLSESVEALSEVDVTSKDGEAIVKQMLEKNNSNYHSEPLIMEGFYRESIKKGKKYASLSEAVVEVYKFPNSSNYDDYARIYKARKSTDYKKIDTLVIKLQGGPYNTLRFDVMKNKDLIFDENFFITHKFIYESVTQINNRSTYVVRFDQSVMTETPMFFGKFYIDTETYALVRGDFSLDLKDEAKASKVFVRKKPTKATVTPTVANYQVDYKLNDGQWYYSYSRLELGFKINWKKKLFNSNYYMTIEKAITDWKVNSENLSLKNKEKLRKNIILNDKVSGFADPDFWGDYNVIEPDKSIENAIKKIQKQMK